MKAIVVWSKPNRKLYIRHIGHVNRRDVMGLIKAGEEIKVVDAFTKYNITESFINKLSYATDEMRKFLCKHFL